MSAIKRWQERPWTQDELRELSTHLADLGTAVEDCAEAISSIDGLVDLITAALGMHARGDIRADDEPRD